MLNFELKKILKSKQPIIIILLALFMAFSSFRSIDMRHFVIVANEKIPYSRESYLNYFVENIEKTDLDEQEQKELKREAISEEFAFLDEAYKESEGLNEERAFILRDAAFKYAEKQLDIIKKYNLKIPTSMQKAIEWNNFEEEIIKKYNTSLYTGPSTVLALNPFRILIESTNSIFGIVPILLIIVLSLAITGKEKSDGSALFSKFSPVKTNKLIFSKLLTSILLALLYSIFAVFFSLIISKMYGYSWLNGQYEIYRIFTEDGSFKYYLAYELLLRIILIFLFMTTFFYFCRHIYL